MNAQERALYITRRILLVVGIIGAVLFSALFAGTFANQAMIERTGQNFIRYQIKKEVSEQNAALDNSKYGDQLQTFKGMFEDEIVQTQAMIENRLDEKIAAIIAQMCRLDCDKRETVRQSVRSGLDERLSRAGLKLSTIEQLIEGKYLQILGALKRDLRVFFGTNVVMFAMVVVAMLVKRKASLQVCLPAALLVVSAVLSICLYAFGQNWFYAILYSSFWGYAYCAYAGLIFAMLLDVFLNRARITTKIIEFVLNIAGSALSVVPC